MVLQKEGRSVRSPCFLIPEASWRGSSEENLDLLAVRLVLGGERVLLLPAGHGETQQRLSPRRGQGRQDDHLIKEEYKTLVWKPFPPRIKCSGLGG